jgi:hypothetical protein
LAKAGGNEACMPRFIASSPAILWINTDPARSIQWLDRTSGKWVIRAMPSSMVNANLLLSLKALRHFLGGYSVWYSRFPHQTIDTVSPGWIHLQRFHLNNPNSSAN